MMFFKGIWIIAKRETKDTFLSPLIYVIAALFIVIVGWLFFNYIISSNEWNQSSLTNSVIVPTFGIMNFLLMFLTPLVTMRSFAEEKKLHTIELLFMSDLSDVQIILGKLVSGMVTMSFLLLLTVVFPIVLAASGYSNWSVVISGYTGLLFSLACYVSAGLFASSLTENQIIAALLGFSLLMGQMLLIISANATQNYIVAQMLQYMSLAFHYEVFARGAVKNYNIVYYFSFVGFFLHLTWISLRSRRW